MPLMHATIPPCFVVVHRVLIYQGTNLEVVPICHRPVALAITVTPDWAKS
jgi:hypothetical protein